ncbi:hypothetical protein [Streptomyces avidinii]
MTSEVADEVASEVAAEESVSVARVETETCSPVLTLSSPPKGNGRGEAAVVSADGLPAMPDSRNASPKAVAAAIMFVAI